MKPVRDCMKIWGNPHRPLPVVVGFGSSRVYHTRPLSYLSKLSRLLYRMWGTGRYTFSPFLGLSFGIVTHLRSYKGVPSGPDSGYAKQALQAEVDQARIETRLLNELDPGKTVFRIHDSIIVED